MVCFFCMWIFLSSFDRFSVCTFSSAIHVDGSFLGSVLLSIDASSVFALSLMRLTSSRSLVRVCFGKVHAIFFVLRYLCILLLFLLPSGAVVTPFRCGSNSFLVLVGPHQLVLRV